MHKLEVQPASLRHHSIKSKGDLQNDTKDSGVDLESTPQSSISAASSQSNLSNLSAEIEFTISRILVSAAQKANIELMSLLKYDITHDTSFSGIDAVKCFPVVKKRTLGQKLRILLDGWCENLMKFRRTRVAPIPDPTAMLAKSAKSRKALKMKARFNKVAPL